MSGLEIAVAVATIVSGIAGGVAIIRGVRKHLREKEKGNADNLLLTFQRGGSAIEAQYARVRAISGINGNADGKSCGRLEREQLTNRSSIDARWTLVGVGEFTLIINASKDNIQQ